MPSTRTDNLIPHRQWYFPNGDIVLKVEGHAFKIPRTLLVPLSRPILDMITEMEDNIYIDPQNKSFRWDGCPKLTCVHDKHVDWNDMLCFLSDPQFLQKNIGRNPAQDIARIFHLVSGILRISTKYRMYPYRKQALSVLALVIPSGSHAEMLAMNARNPFFKTIPNIPREVVYLCRELRIGRFLPWAFYELSRNPVAAITTYQELHGNDRTAILAGRDVVMQMQRTQIYKSFTFAFTPSPNCFTRGGCRLDRRKVETFEGMLNSGPGPLQLLDPDRDLRDERLCASCFENAKMEVREGQKRLWDHLPQIFGLGTWSALRDLD